MTVKRELYRKRELERRRVELKHEKSVLRRLERGGRKGPRPVPQKPSLWIWLINGKLGLREYMGLTQEEAVRYYQEELVEKLENRVILLSGE